MTRRRTWRGLVWLVVPLAVAVVAWTNRDHVRRALALAWEANAAWLLPATLAVGGIYVCRGTAYSVPLRVLRYTFPLSFLWNTALVASAVNQLIPSGGGSGYAFLTYALHQRGASAGQASLVALIDTLSYSAALATLVLIALTVVVTGGHASLAGLLAGFAPGFLFVAVGAWLYWLQRDRARLTRVALAVQRRLGRLRGREWSPEPLRTFLAEYYDGKAVIQRHPGAFFRMVVFQYLAVGCDALALYLAFGALDAFPPFWQVFLGFVVAMAGVSVVSAPGGGGSFELLMSAFFAAHGIDTAEAIAATLLYRIVAFWLPVAASLFTLLAFRRRRKELRRGRRTPSA